MIEDIIEASACLEDGRYVPFVRHPLNELVLGAFMGVLCGAEDWDEIAPICEAKVGVLRAHLPYTNGIASSDTFERAFAVLESGAFGGCVMDVLRRLFGRTAPGIVAIDGKTMKGAKQGSGKALHVLSAFAHEAGIVIGQAAVDGKSNEITAIPDLLNALTLEGSLVTIDAMGTQKTIAAAIRGHKADYLLALKGNQGTLPDDVRLYFDDVHHTMAASSAQTLDYGHGRIEERRCYATDDIAWLRERHTNAYIFGAVCPARDCGVALVLPDSDTYAMNLHLAALGKAVTEGAHAVVIVDGAGWHIADALVVPDHISLLFLPPYSHELNAQENIWGYLRQNFLAARIFETYDAIVDASCNAWNALINQTGRITSIATRDWLSGKCS